MKNTSITITKTYTQISLVLIQQLFKEYALALIKQHQCDQAFALATQMQLGETRDYTLTLLAEEEARHGHFANAEKIAQQILDKEFFEDAVISIVKMHILRHQIKEAFDFTQTIEDMHIRKKCAQALHCAFKASHLKERVRSLEKIFLFPKIGIRIE